jgi:D-alanyl-D-alanine carboxypeptidase
LRYRVLALAAALLLVSCQSGPDPTPRLAGERASAALPYAGRAVSQDPRYAAIVVEAGSGDVLYAVNADQLRYPASLAKMMTLYILFEEIETGRLRTNSELSVSPNAARQPASKLGLRAGSSIRVEDAILAIAVRSANDVAVVVAENISGSEAAFAARMTRTGQSLGLRSTTFRNASGLPDPAQRTTARDMAALARALQTRFPRFYRAFSTRNFTYAGRNYESTNDLLGDIPGMDGIKTGYTRASGYSLATSVNRGGRRIILIVMGEPTHAARSAHVAALVGEHFPSRSGLLAWW